MDYLETCDFCIDLPKGGNTAYNRLYEQDQRIPIKLGDFAAYWDIAPLAVTGLHALLIPVDHKTSFADLHPDSALESLSKLSQLFAEVLDPDGHLVFFEHGSGEIDNRKSRGGKCHVDHAHVHLVSFEKRLNTDELLSKVSSELEGFDNEIGIPFGDKRPYVYVADSSESRCFIQNSPTQIIPSNLVRGIIAEMTGEPLPLCGNWSDMVNLLDPKQFEPIAKQREQHMIRINTTGV